MREFKDDEGRPWRLALTVAAALRVRDMVTVEVDELNADGEPTGNRKSVPFDIVDVGTIHQTLTIVRSQFSKLGEVLYAILVAQVEERKLTKEQFLDGLRGDSLEAGLEALQQELVDFFPLRLRPMVAGMVGKFDELTAKVVEGAMQRLRAVDLNAVSGTPSGSVPALWESGPATGPTGSSQPPAMAA